MKNSPVVDFTCVAATTGTASTCTQTFTLAELQNMARELAALPQPQWTLIAPDGRAWMDANPRELLPVLAGACYPLFPTGAP